MGDGRRSMRRSVLVGGVAAAALLAGGGAAWWRMRPARGAPEALPADFWSRRFDTPEGAVLSMDGLRGKPLLVNFWATWCAPCVEEMPRLDRFFREHAGSGWQVVGLAIDQPSSVRRFLQRLPVSFPIGMAGLEGTELVKALGNSVGGLPFSVLVDPGGNLRERRMGQLSTEELARWKAALAT